MTAALQAKADKGLTHEIVEAMVERDTSFFRDAWPFYMFRDEILAALKKSRASQKKIKIWCAAAATGQEPYSLCMTLRESGADFTGWKFDILATDISSSALEQAKNGAYSQHEVQRGLPVRLLLKYFKQGDGAGWQINSDIRKMVRHQSFNLLDNMAVLGKFDVILCRNVLGGLGENVRQKTIEKLAGQLAPDGFILFGRGEKIEGGAFRPLHEKRGVYVAHASAHAASAA